MHKNGRPDIVLSNRTAFLNYAIERELTSADHFPIILKISTKPIIKPGALRHTLKNVNWELCKESIETKINEENLRNNIEDETQIDQQRLDKLFMNWMNILKGE